MGWSEMEARCRRHPKHRQSKGVCPSCLRERLSQISASSSTHNSSTFSSPGTSYDSASSSAASSSPGTPSATRSRRHRDARAKIGLLMKENGQHPLLGKVREPLTKSRSLAFVISNPLGGGKKEKKEKAEAGEEEKKKSKGEVDGEEEAKKTEMEKKKKRGFWSKLTVGGNKRKEKGALSHSKTVRETTSASARWTFLP